MRLLVRTAAVVAGALVLVGGVTAPAMARDTTTEDVGVAAATCTSSYQYLPSTASVSWNCVLGQGNSGVGVRTLQRSLRECNGQSISVDGIYGPATRNAVVNVQRRASISADGVYGPQTRRNMRWLTATGCNWRR
ncbi:peptidoglycan-binding domain-containing protein [Actinoalloteichus spitiensis]|uniref:peptidoglycan-binding domain-containing protein n=1 Tax=Actinoalloteichus spitiensis TaxID=252394 RepID=UPI0003122878|nr:peptidoglycan-binding domain-containing protein [Actinoalloteichus spitiensis]